MYVSHNIFDPRLVIEELQRRLDSPVLDFHDVYNYLHQWVEEWYEGSGSFSGTIDETDCLPDLMFDSLDFDKISSIQVLPVHWKTIKFEEDETGVPLMIGFPLILVEYSKYVDFG